MQWEFKKQAKEDLEFWKKTDKQKLEKIFNIFESIEKTPYKGIGKPEALKHNLAGCVTQEELIKFIGWCIELMRLVSLFISVDIIIKQVVKTSPKGLFLLYWRC